MPFNWAPDWSSLMPITHQRGAICRVSYQPIQVARSAKWRILAPPAARLITHFVRLSTRFFPSVAPSQTSHSEGRINQYVSVKGVSKCLMFIYYFGWRTTGQNGGFWALRPLPSRNTAPAHLRYIPFPPASDFLLAGYQTLFYCHPYHCKVMIQTSLSL